MQRTFEDELVRLILLACGLFGLQHAAQIERVNRYTVQVNRFCVRQQGFIGFPTGREHQIDDKLVRLSNGLGLFKPIGLNVL